MEQKTFIFGPFRLDLARREVSRGGIPVKLGSRALDILCTLAQAQGDAVSKDALMAAVWPGVVVEENNIQVNISALRKALDDGEGGAGHIMTIPGRGYRLVGLQLAAGSGERGDRAAAPSSATPSIAVLPFQNMSNDPEQDYFADGVVEDIITGLSRSRWLLVTARNSSFVYKGRAVNVQQVARELGVNYVLEGSVRRIADRIRVTAQLIEARNGVHVWAERYDRSLGDIFTVQDDIAINVIGAIEPTVRRAEVERVRRKRPDSIEAYDLVLQALPLVNKMMAESASAAIPLLNKALELEPNYPNAHALLAWCYHVRFSRGGTREEDRILSAQHARAALVSGGDDATTLAIAGLVIWFDQHDFATAFDLFDRALAISNSNVAALGLSAVALAWMGRTQEATERASRALRLSPFDTLHSFTYNALAVAAFHERRFFEARDFARRGIEINPKFSVPRVLLAAALVRLGQIAEAQVEAQVVRALDPTFAIHRYAVTIGVVATVFDPFVAAWREAGLPE